MAVLADSTDVLRHRDFAELTADERHSCGGCGPRSPCAARPGAPRGGIRPDGAPSIRGARYGSCCAAAGSRRGCGTGRERTGRAGWCCSWDVSGSMGPYAGTRCCVSRTRPSTAPAPVGAARGTRTEVFTIGTRLTRVTRELEHRDPDTAMAALAAAVPDWRGGTRLGEMLRGFLDRWGRRGMARGAVVVVLSDGWERGDPALLAEQMRRLHRLAHRVIWANPRKARPGYAPLAGGMAAALPSVDAYIRGHSPAALEELAAVVRGADS